MFMPRSLRLSHGLDSAERAYILKLRPPWPVSRTQLVILQRLKELEDGASSNHTLGDSIDTIFPPSPLSVVSMARFVGAFLTTRSPLSFPPSHPMTVLAMRRNLSQVASSSILGSDFYHYIGFRIDDGSTVNYFAQLPDEVIQEILASLAITDVVAVSAVSKRLNTIANAKCVWLHALKRDWGWPVQPRTGYDLRAVMSEHSEPDQKHCWWKALACNALRMKVEMQCAEQLPKQHYISQWKHFSEIGQEELNVVRREQQQQRRKRYETTLEYIHMAVMPWLFLQCLVIFLVLLPVKMDNAITTYWTIFMLPLWFMAVFYILWTMMGFYMVTNTKAGFHLFGFQLTRRHVMFQFVILGGPVCFMFVTFAALAACNLDYLCSRPWTQVFIPIYLVIGGPLLGMLIAVCLVRPRSRQFVASIYSILLTVTLCSAILQALKHDGIITVSWFIVLIPIWILDAIPTAMFVVFCISFIRTPQPQMRRRACTLLMVVLISIVPIVVELLLVLRAEGFPVTNINAFIIVFPLAVILQAPLFAAMVVRTARLVRELRAPSSR
eukprot:TRINITY_DN3861_c0_g1_i5.p1 TRINITY_DN3861_c0_g1~~TRINITY_DN3861_c0_g1_i5.p1  ORF type:complete len:553 (+),score=89.87 TRINITY_DN3861_c0_g1_i5:452-2110(+)